MTTREQRIEYTGESYELSPDPHYSDRELSRQLAVAQTALGRVQIERNRLQDKLAVLEQALAAWERAYPDLGDLHDLHTRGRFLGACAACAAELKLLHLAEHLNGIDFPAPLAKVAA